MRWPLVAQDHSASAVSFAFRLAAHKKRNLLGQAVDFIGLVGDHLVQFFTQAFKVGETGFKGFGHGELVAEV